MKKYLWMLLAVLAVVFVSCSSDDDDQYIIPQVSPNNLTVSVTSAGTTSGNEKVITVSNAVDLSITQINNKEAGTNNKTTETNVMSVKNGKIKDSKNVTEGGWFSVRVDGKKIIFSVTQNTDTENSRDKYIHVSCGGNVYGLSLHLVQDKGTSSEK